MGYNMFAYCNGNPVMFADPSGTKSSFLKEYSNGILQEILSDKEGSKKTYNAQDRLMIKKSISTGSPVDITKKLNIVMKTNVLRFNQEVVSPVYSNPVTILMEFCERSKSGGDRDIKYQWDLPTDIEYIYDGNTLRYDDIGNLHFGFVGASIYPLDFLLCGAGVYQLYSSLKGEKVPLGGPSPFFDDPRDQEMIKMGYNLYMEMFA